MCAKRCLQRCGDRLLGPLHRLERCSQLGQCRTHGIRDVLRERLGVRRRYAIEHRGVLGDFLYRGSAVLQQTHYRSQIGALRNRGFVDTQLGEERLGEFREARVVRFLDVVRVEPVQLVVVVLRRRLAQMLQIEPFHELLAREDFRVTMRPARRAR